MQRSTASGRGYFLAGCPLPSPPSPQLRRNRSPLSIRVVRRGGIHACGSACALVHKAQGRAAYIYDPGPVVHNSVGPRTDEVVVAGLVLPRRNLSVRDNATHKYLTSSLSLSLCFFTRGSRDRARPTCAHTCAAIPTDNTDRAPCIRLRVRVKVSGQKNWRTILALSLKDTRDILGKRISPPSLFLPPREPLFTRPIRRFVGRETVSERYNRSFVRARFGSMSELLGIIELEIEQFL